jgi:hypothetical protein
VTGSLELSDEGKAMKFFAVNPFALTLTLERLAQNRAHSGARDAEARQHYLKGH